MGIVKTISREDLKEKIDRGDGQESTKKGSYCYVFQPLSVG